jgi:DNA-binding transcriptional ArsR family regulator
MTTPLQAALVELKDRREKLDAAISAIEGLIGETPAETVLPVMVRQPRRKAETTSGASNGAVEDDRILSALRVKSPQSPAELAKALKLARARLTYQIKPLLKSGAVLATGATMNRQFSLPPRSRAAKEVP